MSVPKGDAIFMKVKVNLPKHPHFILFKIRKEYLLLFTFPNIFQWICHDWSDEHCIKFLKNCYDSLPQNGKVILAECVLPEEPDTGLATKNVVHIDVIMLAHNPGGKERTEKEFHNLAKAAGFKDFNKACCAYNTWIIELLK